MLDIITQNNSIVEYSQNYNMIPINFVYQQKKSAKILQPRSSFSNADDLSDHFDNLIDLEIEAIENGNKSLPFLNQILEFDYRDDNNCIITIKNPNFKLFEKNTIDIYQNRKLIIKGATIFSKKNDSAILFCPNLTNQYNNGQYQIKLKESFTNYERMKIGLGMLGIKNAINSNILQMILGEVQDLNINIRDKNVKKIALIPKLVQEYIKMNPSQEKGILNALMYYLSIIIGPPGSGKTLLLVNLVYNIKLIKGSTEKILICAQTNQAIDNIIKHLKKFDFDKYVRVLSPAKELSEELDITNSVHKLAKDKIYNNRKKYDELIKLIERREKNGYLSKKDHKIYKERIGDIEDKIIEDADIVLSTLNNSADERLKDKDFAYVVIDEAAQALEPDTILPLVHNSKMVCLIGDDKQLGPIVHSKIAEYNGFGISLFERIHSNFKDAPFITLLNEQYRMNEKLYEFPNKAFYENKMITKIKILPDDNFPWPKKDFPSFFYNVSGSEDYENKSVFNKDEVLSLYQCVNKLKENKIDLKNIGVITYYKAQKQRFYEKFYSKEEYLDLKIDTVDGFQGMEMDYIIISTVRSNENGDLGFINIQKRLNVSLTRAKKGLIIIGDAKCLAKKRGIFRDLIFFYYSNGLIMNGPFNKNIKIMKMDEILEAKDLLNDEEEFDEILEEMNERNYNGFKRIKVIKKIKNENPAPPIAIEKQNISKDNQNKEQNKKIEYNNINHNNKNKKKEEKKEEIKEQQKKPKKKKKVKKELNEEEQKEKEEKEEEKELKKKGNKKWKTKNLYNKKKNKLAKQQEEMKEDSKVEEEEKIEEDDNSGKNVRKNHGKKKKGYKK